MDMAAIVGVILLLIMIWMTGGEKHFVDSGHHTGDGRGDDENELPDVKWARTRGVVAMTLLSTMPVVAMASTRGYDENGWRQGLR